MSSLSNQQLFHQAALILDATSPYQIKKAEARVPPKPLGPLEARVLPAEARVPPKPQVSWRNRFLSTEATFLDSSSLLDGMTPLPTQSPFISSSTLEHLTMSELLPYAHRLAHSPKTMAKQHHLGRPTRPIEPVNGIPEPVNDIPPL